MGAPSDKLCPTCRTRLLSNAVYMTLFALWGVGSGIFLGSALWISDQGNKTPLILWGLFGAAAVWKVKPLSRIWIHVVTLLISGFVTFKYFMES
jgi:hypothetical protein